MKGILDRVIRKSLSDSQQQTIYNLFRNLEMPFALHRESAVAIFNFYRHFRIHRNGNKTINELARRKMFTRNMLHEYQKVYSV